ncbi:MAG: glycosyltransferase family 4 protein [Candidatus Didemnitutus sp.]|nr:glycosyltransferase family 4 protein [Candidatus Didemnitutus sp.]
MKVLLLASFDRSLVNFRGPLIRDLVAAGCKVVAAAPAESKEVPRQVEDLGARFVGVELARTGLNPWADFRTYRRLRRLIATEKPDVVLGYTIKPVIYGSLAAGSEGVARIVALITGLGTAFHSTGLKGRTLRTVALMLYRVSLRRAHRVVVQNPDIAALFIAERIAEKAKLTVVRGSGVDLVHFAERAVPAAPMRFLYLGRLLRDKGLAEFATAARQVRAVCPEAECRIVGGADPNPTGISLAEVHAWQAEGILTYAGHCSDVRPELEAATVYVLPSYHEGMPRSVLEAMAVGRAIITTDTIGCRETVRLRAGMKADAHRVLEGENGLLVPVRDAEALAEAMLRLARDPSRVRAMGARSRAIAVEEFDVRKVNAAMLGAMGVGASREGL